MTSSMIAWRRVIGLRAEHRQGRVGEHGVAPDPGRLAMGFQLSVLGVGVADAAHDQWCALTAGFASGGERG